MGNFIYTSKFSPAYRSRKVRMLSVIMVLLLIMMQEVVFGQPSATFTTAGTSTYTIPAGVRKVSIEAWGAGGGGGGDADWLGTGAGGGGGGAYAKINSFTVTPLNSYTYTVGAAGSAGSSSSGDGGNGGNSTFNTNTCVAQGGRGGIGGNDGTGGAGGTTASSTGDIKYAGGAGFQGYTSPNTRGGGGGGSAGTGGQGNSATSVTGASAVTGGGPGGNGGDNSAGSAPASGPGGGGGGGENSGTSGRAGGAGYAGQVRISWTCPSISLTSGSNTPTVCINTAITNIVYTIGDNYVAANVTGLPTGVSYEIVGTTLTISGTPSVTAGSPYNYTITLTKPTGCANDAVASGTITVQPISSAPTINGTYCPGGTSVSGTSIEGNGTTINVYKAGSTLIGSTTVSSGAWTATVSALAVSEVITATATASGKCVSAASSGTTVQSNSAAPVITGTYCPAGTSVSGTSSEADGTGIIVYKAGTTLIGTASVSGGAWTATVGALAASDVITATATAGGKCVSATSSGVTVNPLPTFSILQTNVSCNGGNDGSIKVTVLSGTPNYEFSKNGGNDWTTPQAGTEYTFGSLTVAGGPYNIRVRDGNQCVATNCQP